MAKQTELTLKWLDRRTDQYFDIPWKGYTLAPGLVACRSLKWAGYCEGKHDFTPGPWTIVHAGSGYTLRNSAQFPTLKAAMKAGGQLAELADWTTNSKILIRDRQLMKSCDAILFGQDV